MAGEYAAAVDPREGPFEFNEWRGLRNNVDPTAFAPGDLTVATNIDIDDALAVMRRKGYSAVVTAAVDRDVWASGSICLGVGSDALKQIHADYSTTTLRAGLAAGRHLDYEVIGDRVFWSNGVETGVVQNGANRSWGLSIPGKPTAAATAGTLAAGLYQVAVTYLRSDGQESGAGLAVTLTLDAIGGIALSSIPVSADSTVTHKAIYATSVGGDTLHQVGIIANATTSFSIISAASGAAPLLTQFLQPPPAGDFIAESSGHLLVAVGSRLYPSEAYGPELFDYRRAVPFNDAITMLAPVSDGLYVGTQSQVIWIPGSAPENWEYRPVAASGVIPGTLTYADSSMIGDGSGREPVALFATQHGLCAGAAGGAVTNLTADRFAYPIQTRGAGIARRHRGINQYLCTMQGAETAGSVAG